jgi:transposase
MYGSGQYLDMARPAQHLDVSVKDLETIKALLKSGVQQVRVVLRALAIRHLGSGRTASEVADLVGLTGKAVRAIARRYRQHGLERALYEKARPGKKPLLDASTEQRIIAMVCGAPPEGRARWSIRLIVSEAVKRKLVPRLGRETLRLLLESHELKPWREKHVVSAGDRRHLSGSHGRRAGAVRAPA